MLRSFGRLCFNGCIPTLLMSMVFLLASCEYQNEEELFAKTANADPEDCNIGEVTYQANVLPILERHCLTCHDERNGFGNVVLEGIENVRIYANSGQLLGSIDHQPGFSAMPDNGEKLPVCEIEMVRKWIDSGTPQ